MRAGSIAFAVSLATFFAHVAHAQPVDKDADNERLFREAQKLMEDRRYGEACPKLDAVYRKDQQLGTLLNLAYCHKELGATWLAWVEFKEAEVKASELKRAERRDFARARMAELEKSLARIIIEPTSRVELTEVLVEDRWVPDAEKSIVVAAELGPRKLTFRARGKKPVVQLVTIVKSSAPMRIPVPEMEDQPRETPPSEPVVKVVLAPAPAPPKPVIVVKASSTQRNVGLVLGGLGVVGLGVGSVFGLMTLYNACTDGLAAPGQTGPSCTLEEYDSASTKGAVSDIAFIGGGAALATGLVLYFTAPRAASMAGRAPRLTPEIGPGWARIRGAF